MVFRNTDKVSFFMLFTFYVSTVLVGYYFYEKDDFTKDSNSLRYTLNHFVLLKFNDSISNNTLKMIQNASYKLQEIEEVKDFYFGENISLRGMDKGFTHIISMKFKNSYEMDSIYLPHPIHKEFSAIFRPHTEDILVYDFWD